MTHQNRRPWMVVVSEQLLQRHRLRLILLHYFYYTIVQGTKTWGEVSCAFVFGGADDPRLTDVGAGGTDLEDGVASNSQAGVNAKEARARRGAVAARNTASLPRLLRPVAAAGTVPVPTLGV